MISNILEIFLGYAAERFVPMFWGTTTCLQQRDMSNLWVARNFPYLLGWPSSICKLRKTVVKPKKAVRVNDWSQRPFETFWAPKVHQISDKKIHWNSDRFGLKLYPKFSLDLVTPINENLGGTFNYLFMFTPNPWGRWSHLDDQHFSQWVGSTTN